MSGFPEYCFNCIHAGSAECDAGAGYTMQDEYGVCPPESRSAWSIP